MRHCGYWLGFLHTRARMRLWACACAFARAGKCVLVHAPARSPPPCRAALGGAGRQAGKLCLLLPPLKLQGRAADVELESLVRPGTVLRPGGQLGTWRYMAPERVLAALAGRRPQLHRRPGLAADVWIAALVLAMRSWRARGSSGPTTTAGWEGEEEEERPTDAMSSSRISRREEMKDKMFGTR